MVATGFAELFSIIDGVGAFSLAAAGTDFEIESASRTGVAGAGIAEAGIAEEGIAEEGGGAASDPLVPAGRNEFVSPLTGADHVDDVDDDDVDDAGSLAAATG